MKLNFYYLLLFSLTFILFTVIGTLSHEYGHIIAAESQGYNTILHYGSMSTYIPESKAAEMLSYEQQVKERLIVTMGGPIQTMLTGMIGLTILFIRRKKYVNGFKLFDWLAVFLSLFWLREVFNLFSSLSRGIINQNGRYFGGDEARISRILELPVGTMPVILGILGLCISLFVIFKVIPKKLRSTFILSGLIGGGSGFYLWMNLVGPVLLP